MMPQAAAPAGSLGELQRKTLGLLGRAGDGVAIALWVLVAFGHAASDTVATLIIAFGLILTAIVSLLAAGPQRATLGMALGA